MVALGFQRVKSGDAGRSRLPWARSIGLFRGLALRSLDPLSLVTTEKLTASTHSWRKASMGSRREARRAGIHPELRATASNKSAAPRTDSGSVAFTP